MKKLITILTISLLLSSCNTDTVIISKEDYQKLKGDIIKSEYPKVYDGFKIYKIRNCEYIQIPYETAYRSTQYNYIHAGDCKFCKKDTL